MLIMQCFCRCFPFFLNWHKHPLCLLQCFSREAVVTKASISTEFHASFNIALSAVVRLLLGAAFLGACAPFNVSDSICSHNNCRVRSEHSLLVHFWSILLLYFVVPELHICSAFVLVPKYFLRAFDQLQKAISL